MKYIIPICLVLMTITSCKKNPVLETVDATVENQTIESIGFAPTPAYQWALMPKYEVPYYPHNLPEDDNLVMVAGGVAYFLTGDLLSLRFKLNNSTKQWEINNNPSVGYMGFAVFSVGFQYLFSHEGKIYNGLMQGGPEYNENAFGSLDPINGVTQSLAPYPGITTANPLCFVANGKGYIISGYTKAASPLVWEYNFTANTWTNKGNSPLGKRNGAVVFVANNKVYMGLGYENINLNGQTIKRYKRDWLEYIPGSIYSIVKADFPGQLRRNAEGFVIGNTPYLGFGKNSTTYFKDFWKYNVSSNTWTQQPNWPGTTSTVNNNLAVFSLGTTGYVAKGRLAEFWRYSNSIFYP